MRNTKILIVDDHMILRAGMKAIIDHVPEFDIVGEANDGEKALEMIDTYAIDVVLMDIQMPGMNGIECTHQIAEQYPNVKVIALTMHDGELYIKEMLRSGVSGYLLKNSPKQDIINAIKTVMSGEKYYGHRITDVIMEGFGTSGISEGSGQRLTEREKDVLKLIVKEKSNKEIAEALFISIRTVDAHKRNLLEKTGARNSVGLVKYAMMHDLVE